MMCILLEKNLVDILEKRVVLDVFLSELRDEIVLLRVEF